MRYELKAKEIGAPEVMAVMITVYDQHDDIAMTGELDWQDGVTIWQSELIVPRDWMEIAQTFNAALVEAYEMITTEAKTIFEDEKPVP